MSFQRPRETFMEEMSSISEEMSADTEALKIWVISFDDHLWWLHRKNNLLPLLAQFKNALPSEQQEISLNLENSHSYPNSTQYRRSTETNVALNLLLNHTASYSHNCSWIQRYLDADNWIVVFTMETCCAFVCT